MRKADRTQLLLLLWPLAGILIAVLLGTWFHPALGIPFIVAGVMLWLVLSFTKMLCDRCRGNLLMDGYRKHLRAPRECPHCGTQVE